MMIPSISIQAMRSIGYFLSGVCLGSLATIAVIRLKSSEENEEVDEDTFLDEEIDTAEINPVEEPVRHIPPKSAEKPSIDSIVANYKTMEEELVDYTKFYKSEQPESENIVEELAEEEAPLDEDDPDYEDDILQEGEEAPDYADPPKPKHKHPYTITEDEYISSEGGYDKLYLSFYAFDKTLSTDHDELITDVNSVVGNALDDFIRHAEQGIEPKNTLLWVRNDQLGVDYEISYISGSYLDGSGYGAPYV